MITSLCKHSSPLSMRRSEYETNSFTQWICSVTKLRFMLGCIDNYVDAKIFTDHPRGGLRVCACLVQWRRFRYISSPFEFASIMPYFSTYSVVLFFTNVCSSCAVCRAHVIFHQIIPWILIVFLFCITYFVPAISHLHAFVVLTNGFRFCFSFGPLSRSHSRLFFSRVCLCFTFAKKFAEFCYWFWVGNFCVRPIIKW